MIYLDESSSAMSVPTNPIPEQLKTQVDSISVSINISYLS